LQRRREGRSEIANHIKRVIYGGAPGGADIRGSIRHTTSPNNVR
jgi:hypothetical protein